MQFIAVNENIKHASERIKRLRQETCFGSKLRTSFGE